MKKFVAVIVALFLILYVSAQEEEYGSDNIYEPGPYYDQIAAEYPNVDLGSLGEEATFGESNGIPVIDYNGATYLVESGLIGVAPPPAGQPGLLLTAEDQSGPYSVVVTGQAEAKKSTGEMELTMTSTEASVATVQVANVELTIPEGTQTVHISNELPQNLKPNSMPEGVYLFKDQNDKELALVKTDGTLELDSSTTPGITITNNEIYANNLEALPYDVAQVDSDGNSIVYDSEQQMFAQLEQGDCTPTGAVIGDITGMLFGCTPSNRGKVEQKQPQDSTTNQKVQGVQNFDELVSGMDAKQLDGLLKYGLNGKPLTPAQRQRVQTELNTR